MLRKYATATAHSKPQEAPNSVSSSPHQQRDEPPSKAANGFKKIFGKRAKHKPRHDLDSHSTFFGHRENSNTQQQQQKQKKRISGSPMRTSAGIRLSVLMRSSTKQPRVVETSQELLAINFASGDPAPVHPPAHPKLATTASETPRGGTDHPTTAESKYRKSDRENFLKKMLTVGVTAVTSKQSTSDQQPYNDKSANEEGMTFQQQPSTPFKQPFIDPQESMSSPALTKNHSLLKKKTNKGMGIHALRNLNNPGTDEEEEDQVKNNLITNRSFFRKGPDQDPKSEPHGHPPESASGIFRIRKIKISSTPSRSLLKTLASEPIPPKIFAREIPKEGSSSKQIPGRASADRVRIFQFDPIVIPSTKTMKAGTPFFSPRAERVAEEEDTFGDICLIDESFPEEPIQTMFKKTSSQKQTGDSTPKSFAGGRSKFLLSKEMMRNKSKKYNDKSPRRQPSAENVSRKTDLGWSDPSPRNIKKTQTVQTVLDINETAKKKVQTEEISTNPRLSKQLSFKTDDISEQSSSQVENVPLIDQKQDVAAETVSKTETESSSLSDKVVKQDIGREESLAAKVDKMDSNSSVVPAKTDVTEKSTSLDSSSQTSKNSARTQDKAPDATPVSTTEVVPEHSESSSKVDTSIMKLIAQVQENPQCLYLLIDQLVTLKERPSYPIITELLNFLVDDKIIKRLLSFLALTDHYEIIDSKHIIELHHFGQKNSILRDGRAYVVISLITSPSEGQIFREKICIQSPELLDFLIQKLTSKVIDDIAVSSIMRVLTVLGTKHENEMISRFLLNENAIGFMIDNYMHIYLVYRFLSRLCTRTFEIIQFCADIHLLQIIADAFIRATVSLSEKQNNLDRVTIQMESLQELYRDCARRYIVFMHVPAHNDAVSQSRANHDSLDQVNVYVNTKSHFLMLDKAIEVYGASCDLPLFTVLYSECTLLNSLDLWLKHEFPLNLETYGSELTSRLPRLVNVLFTGDAEGFVSSTSDYKYRHQSKSLLMGIIIMSTKLGLKDVANNIFKEDTLITLDNYRTSQNSETMFHGQFLSLLENILMTNVDGMLSLREQLFAPSHLNLIGEIIQASKFDDDLEYGYGGAMAGIVHHYLCSSREEMSRFLEADQIKKFEVICETSYKTHVREYGKAMYDSACLPEKPEPSVKSESRTSAIFLFNRKYGLL